MPASPQAALKLPPISEQIWDLKYRLKAADASPLEATLADTWQRVARAGASVEKRRERERWEARFFEAMNDLTFLPAGRIIAGAGSGRNVTLFNCFVMGTIEDDLESIFDNVKEAALTMQRGGGIGHDFSTLRPAGALVRSVGAGASGPVSFMDVWDAMCRTIMSAGQRRGAMMGTLRCDHPDIEAFIDAKSDPNRLRNFNLSVLVTDAFMAAVRDDREWSLSFDGAIFRTVRARALWDRIMRATYEFAEPGVIFIDRINRQNNLAYCEEIKATNPCGEQPLPPYGACLLGSINLARLVMRPFDPRAVLDEARLEGLTALAVRFLDNVIDVSAYPLPAQKREAKAKRRIGLGVTGLADALVMCGVRYGTPEAVKLAGRWMSLIDWAAYHASAELAGEKGAFPLFEQSRFLVSPNVTRLPAPVRALITKHGMRNGCLTSIAPTGTISLLAGNVSSGIEPVFDYRYIRRVREAGDQVREEVVEDFAHARFRTEFGADCSLPSTFVTANELSPSEHLVMQAAAQAHVDSAISKTINCPEDMPFEAFKEIYERADALGLKGCTTFRPNPVTGSILEAKPVEAHATELSARAKDGGGMPSPTPSVGKGAEPASIAKAAAEQDAAVNSRDQSMQKLQAGDRSGARPVALIDRVAERARDSVVYMSRPIERDQVLAGYTYKLKWAGSDHAIYVTINDIEKDGRRRPFEIFINTKNLEHYAWTVALTRMISAVFRRGGDISFVVEELKAVFDPQGGHWMEGRYVPSLLAAIGGIIETHLRRIGWLQEGHAGQLPADNLAEHERERLPAFPVGGQALQVGSSSHAENTGPRHGLRLEAGKMGRSQDRSSLGEPMQSGDALRPAGTGRLCPRCHAGRLISQSGCWVCRDCGYSRCG